jgi:Enoyl-CoA hydratase/isomerase
MDKLLYEKRDRIALLTINRPDDKNAIDPDVHRLMIEAWTDLRDDDRLDVAILTGAGDAFCAGADLKSYIPPKVAGATPGQIRDIVELGLNGSRVGCTGSRSRSSPQSNVWALAGGLETAGPRRAPWRVHLCPSAFGVERRRGAAQPTSSGSSSGSALPASRERPRRTAERNFSRLTSSVERISSA